MNIKITYVVKPENTLSGIAHEYKMTLEQLLNIPGNERYKAHPDLIYPGNVVYLSTDGVAYSVVLGDTLTKIAQRYNMTLRQLLDIAENQQFINNPDLIHPGDKVYVFKIS
ncbi:LysM peptidoglycan-binding domain-containing protein [Candidatus Tisiphia endosymbiont of Parasteatoda lunata]|uniref:LysM peptidoglycan-binding domain-containing protein n=1 Tax=Candidatus Tisiphia endosymbiont of Parasteatoda lunata TaxID=3066275 RepID=UPI00313C2031